jgi:hypothetical protein
MSFKEVTETNSLRSAARLFAAASDVKDARAVEYTEQCFIAGAAWAWKRMELDIEAKKRMAQKLIKGWK